jgi:hypothetical protein
MKISGQSSMFALLVVLPFLPISAQMPSKLLLEPNASAPATAAPQVEIQKTSISTTIDAEMLRYTSFKRDVADQLNLLKTNADDVAPGAGVRVEIDRAGIPLFFQTGFHYNRQTFTQTYNPSGPLFPNSADGTVDGISVDLNFGFRMRPFDRRHLSWAFYGGPTWAHDKEKLTFHYNTMTQDENRTLSTWKGNFGTSIRLETNSRITWDVLDLGYTTSFKKNDADSNFRVSTGIGLTLGPRNKF